MGYVVHAIKLVLKANIELTFVFKRPFQKPLSSDFFVSCYTNA